MESPRRSASVLLLSLILFLYWTTSSAQSHDPTSADLSAINKVKRQVSPMPPRTREMVASSLLTVKDVFNVAKDVKKVSEVLKSLGKFGSMAPGALGAFFSLINVILVFLPQENDPVMRELKEGFAEVNRKLDSLSIQVANLATDVEWFNYASVYSQDEMRILNTWKKFEEFRENSASVQTQEEKLQLAEIFTNYYEYTGTESSVSNLYHYLTVSGTSLSGNLNVLLRKKFKCDIREIGKYNVYFDTLLWRGLALNRFYWKLIGLNPPGIEAKHKQMFMTVYKAQLSAVDSCVNNYEQYVREDVEKITNSIHHDNKQVIAEEVKKVLDEKYDWYSWVVVVYNNDQEQNFINVEMIQIRVGTITVAVGHTLIGGANLPYAVRDVSKHCFESKECKISKDQIDTCNIPGWLPPIDSPLAEPAFIKFTHFAKLTHATYGTEFIEVPQPFEKLACLWGYYGGKLSIYLSRTEPVCNNNPCQNGGECRRLGDSNQGLCICTDGYYGDRCGEKGRDIEPVDLPPVPTITSTNSRLKRLEFKLDQLLSGRCPGY